MAARVEPPHRKPTKKETRSKRRTARNSCAALPLVEGVLLHALSPREIMLSLLRRVDVRGG